MGAAIPKLLPLTLALAGVEAANIYCDSLTYVGINSAHDEWCQATCNQWTGSHPGFCPDSICQCPPPEEPVEPGCANPRSCPDDLYKANPGTTATDEWCQATCTAATPVCPCTMCLCQSGCGEGQEELTLTFDDISGVPPTLYNSYAGFSWDQFLGVIDADPVFPFPNGYTNGRVSSPNVGANPFADPLTFRREDGTEFKVLSAALTATWRNDMNVEIRAYDAGNTEIGLYSATVDFDTPLQAEINLPNADHVTITSFGGVNPGNPLDGEELAFDDLVVCVEAASRSAFSKSPQAEADAEVVEVQEDAEGFFDSGDLEEAQANAGEEPRREADEEEEDEDEDDDDDDEDDDEEEEVEQEEDAAEEPVDAEAAADAADEIADILDDEDGSGSS